MKKSLTTEMDHVLLGIVKAVVDAEQETLTPLWKPATKQY